MDYPNQETVMTGQFTPPVSVIIPVRNAARTLKSTIESVLNQTYSEIIEIILSIGPSNDQTLIIAKDLQGLDPRIKIITNTSGKTARGLNLAAQIASGQYFVRVDSHCRLTENYIKFAVDKITETGAGNVGGIQRAAGESIFQKSIAAAMSSKFGVGNSKFHYGGAEGPTDTVYLGVYDAELFRELSGFDEELIRNQDYELNIRIRNSGRLVWFTPELQVFYYPRKNLGSLAKQYFEYGTWKRKVIVKHPDSLKLRQIIPPTFVIATLLTVILGLTVNNLFLMAPISYAFAVMLATLTIRNIKPIVRLGLFVAFPTMHIFWGLGFLIGKEKKSIPKVN
tara:strand:- start:188 stop:1201 length:1014 start_codon:yes stop_codon:yes gene_type:complete